MNHIRLKKIKEAKIVLGTKPCLVFNGEPFEIDPEYARLKCLLTGIYIIADSLLLTNND